MAKRQSIEEKHSTKKTQNGHPVIAPKAKQSKKQIVAESSAHIKSQSLKQSQPQSNVKTERLSKQRITVQISEDVIDRVKNAVYWTPGLTIASLAETAFVKVVDELERQRGESFLKRREELKSGRPIS